MQEMHENILKIEQLNSDSLIFSISYIFQIGLLCRNDAFIHPLIETESLN